MSDDPFVPEADPQCAVARTFVRVDGAGPHECHCEGPASASRRHVLRGIGLIAALPAMAAAESVTVPCVQDKQKVKPCRHRFCRHYAGEGDYHGR